MLGIELLLEIIDRDDVGKIPFVVLDGEGNLVELQIVIAQVLMEVVNALDIRVITALLGVGDEDESINTA